MDTEVTSDINQFEAESDATSELILGKQIQTARKKAGLTQQDLCNKAGLSYSTLAKIERGAIKAPSIFTIQSIAAVLAISIGELLGEAPIISVPTTRYRSKSGIRFIYFDINGCLVRFFHRAFTQLAADSGESADIIETTFWHYNDAVCRGEMPLADFDQAMAKQLRMGDLNWQKYYMEAVDAIAEMHELVKWASEYYDVGLLSNIMPGFIDEMLKSGLLPDVKYKAIIDSSKTGAIKPEPEIFEAAQHFTDCDPSEVLFVDDSRANIMAAEKFGWRVLWFDDYRPEESSARVKTALELGEQI